MRTQKKIIQTRVADEEYEIILQNAKNLNMQIGPYVRRTAREFIVIQPNYSVIEQHTREIANVRKIINLLIWTIEACNCYLPKEIKAVVELMQNIFEAENAILRLVTQDRYEVLRRMITDRRRNGKPEQKDIDRLH